MRGWTTTCSDPLSSSLEVHGVALTRDSSSLVMVAFGGDDRFLDRGNLNLVLMDIFRFLGGGDGFRGGVVGATVDTEESCVFSVLLLLVVLRGGCFRVNLTVRFSSSIPAAAAFTGCLFSLIWLVLVPFLVSTESTEFKVEEDALSFFFFMF